MKRLKATLLSKSGQFGVTFRVSSDVPAASCPLAATKAAVTTRGWAAWASGAAARGLDGVLARARALARTRVERRAQRYGSVSQTHARLTYDPSGVDDYHKE
eukprot:6204003-Pleurochrysis_carterae.AAC.3